MKVPAALATGVICFALGAGGAVAVLFLMGFEKPNREAPPEGQGPPGQDFPPFGKKDAFGKFGPPMEAKPSERTAIISLVKYLSIVSGNAPKLKLTKEQQDVIVAQLRKLAHSAELSNEESSKGMEAILTVLKDDVKTLEKLGFALPDDSKLNPYQEIDNPFSGGIPREQLAALFESFGIELREVLPAPIPKK